MGQGRSQQMSDSRFAKGVAGVVGNATFVFDLVEFWIAGVIGLAIFGSIIVTVVHGGMPWECEEHVTIVSGAANLGFHMNQTHPDAAVDTRGDLSGIDALASHYECEYMTSTASFGTKGGMCEGCAEIAKELICKTHKDSLGCKWYAKDVDKLGNAADTDEADRNWGDCTDATTADAVANVGCCLYEKPTTDDQLHDVCYSIDQYVHDEHYPNFVGDYKEQVKNARTFAILGYAFGFAAFAMRVLYHVPLLSNAVGGADYQSNRDYWVRLADLAFLTAAFVFVILTFTQLDDVLMDNRKHLWGEKGVFNKKAHVDAVEEQLVASTGFYALAVYATFLGINVVWFVGTQVGIIPNHPTHQQGEVELRGIAFRAEHA
tara:strand:- start:5251 stop:6375 length:1125 start_codon:yes stop_codon:yes gene_type:complete